IDWRRVERWIQSCGETHKTCIEDARRAPLNPLPGGFRVVDVLHRCIVRPPDLHFQYVALSYTWGRAPNLARHILTTSSMPHYMEHGSLHPLQMPATIEDAMQMCLNLGKRYLWVDRLCIMQDNIEDRESQIKGMATIFSRAAFTIVAAYGNGMDTSLPGVQARAFSTDCDDLGDLHIRTCLPTFDDTVRESVWATRGWTYQEALLSPKKLYISSAQAFWVCQSGMIPEDLIPDDSIERITCNELIAHKPYTEVLKIDSWNSDPFTPYTYHSRKYNQRVLTNASDIYDAFGGIMSALYPPVDPLDQTSTSLYNLPLHDFDAALLWSTGIDTQGARASDENTYIPSWSWSSVVGDF
ncbi:HET-domain-containing protein, partial [Pleomassaria siparia CBS 279.74]